MSFSSIDPFALHDKTEEVVTVIPLRKLLHFYFSLLGYPPIDPQIEHVSFEILLINARECIAVY